MDVIIHALENMGQNEESIIYLNKLIQDDPVLLLRIISSLILSDKPDQIVKNAVLLMGIILRPTIVNTIDDISKCYYMSMNDDDRIQIKQACLKALMYEDNSIRSCGAFCMCQIATIEVPNRKWNDLFNYLGELVNNDDYGQFAQIGAVEAMKNILQVDGLITRRFREFRKAGLITVASCMKFLEVLEISPCYRAEAANCLYYAIKIFY